MFTESTYLFLKDTTTLLTLTPPAKYLTLAGYPIINLSLQIYFTQRQKTDLLAFSCSSDKQHEGDVIYFTPVCSPTATQPASYRGYSYVWQFIEVKLCLA